MIIVNLDKSKELAHRFRRNQRDAEFEPLDSLIAKQIPGTNVAAIEAQRQEIRDKYATMQVQIDAATDLIEIRSALGLDVIYY
jgi:hypothetical protein